MSEYNEAPRLSIDRWLVIADVALRTLSGGVRAGRPTPVPADSPTLVPPNGPESMTAGDRRLSGALMRVNHVGEVCAQALYSAQALGTRDEALRRQFEHAAREETDHLAWTRDRLDQLGARPSWLNPLWYAGSFAIGLAASRMGDRISLGFVVETERQVEQHLESHLERLPADDTASRAIVRQMKADEARHGAEAQAAGAARLPTVFALAMRLVSRVMTTTAHRI